MNNLVPELLPNAIDQLANLLKAGGDPLRLEIIRILANDSFGVMELADIFGIKQSGISHHLKVLSQAELLTTRREGNSIFYRRSSLSDSFLFNELKHSLFEAADQIDLSQNIIEGIEKVFVKRAEISQAFFSHHAMQLQEQQELIAAFNVYGKHVETLINHVAFIDKQHALEIGPGSGEFLEYLATQFDSVIALDNNRSLLEEAQKNNSRAPNILFEHGDSTYCKNQEGIFSCVVANMVLHHTPSPIQIFEDVAFALKKGGSFIVCDLTQHDQDWARQACGDQWLGFEPSQLTEWAEKFQLSSGQSEYFALRNGFQIQIRQFIKS